MKGTRKQVSKGSLSETVLSRIKNPDLVRKKQLLIARKASILFRKKGYDQTTMREISKATGMAIGNLYDYISKKEDVLSLVFDVYHQYVEESLAGDETLQSADPKEQLLSFIKNSVKNVQHFRDEIVLMYRESRMLPKEHLERAMRRELEQIRLLESIIQRGVDQGLFHVKEPYFVASLLFYQLTLPAFRGWTFKDKYTDEKINLLIEEYVLKPIIN